MPAYVLDCDEFEIYKNRTDLGIGNETLSERILNMTGIELISNEEIISRFRKVRCIHHKYILTKPIKEYGGHEISTCIREKVLLEYALPIMSRYLEVCPLTPGAYHIGEVLVDILELDQEFWGNHQEWYLYVKNLAVESVRTYGLEELRNELEPIFLRF